MKARKHSRKLYRFIAHHIHRNSSIIERHIPSPSNQNLIGTF
jgi:hypothetical protein